MKCKICGQEDVSIVKGLCAAHYQRARRGVPMDTPVVRKTPGAICSVSECDRLAIAKGVCKRHYNKVRVHGDPNAGKQKGKYRKSPIVSNSGYVTWYDPESIYANTHGHVYEHRAVMGEKIGRALFPHENVHHLNGDRRDNRLENLELWSTMQPPGQRVSDKLVWAKEIIQLYGGLA